MPIAPPPTTRLEAFTDAVVAIALTIMVLELRPADVVDQPTLATALAIFGPKFLVYSLSFVVILRIWINHHRLLETALRTTTAMFWLNGLLLFWLTLIPFATALLGVDPLRPLASATYGIVMAMTSAAFSLLRFHVLAGPARPGAERVVSPIFVRLSAAVVLPYLLAVPLAFFSSKLSLAIFIAMPLALFAIDIAIPPGHDQL
jgi:uncharacterized membrane protein